MTGIDSHITGYPFNPSVSKHKGRHQHGLLITRHQQNADYSYLSLEDFNERIDVFLKTESLTHSFFQVQKQQKSLINFFQWCVGEMVKIEEEYGDTICIFIQG